MDENLPTRSNNPGDLRNPKTGAFQTFTTPTAGTLALYNDLTSKMTGASSTGLNGSSSLFDFAKVYAPASDDNNPVSYAANLANSMGVSPDTNIGSLMPKIDQFASAIAKNEGWQGSLPTMSGSTPQTTPSNNSGGMPTWEKVGLGIAGGLGVAGATYLTGGLDLLLPALGAAAGIAIPAAEGGVGAAVVNKIFGGSGNSNTQSSGQENPVPTSQAPETFPQAQASSATQSQQPQQPQQVEQVPTVPQPETQPETQTSPTPIQASQSLMQAQTQALQQTPTGRVMANSPEIQEAVATNAKYGLNPGIDESTGAMDSTEAIKRSEKMVGDISDNMAQALDAEGTHVNLDEAVSLAKVNMRKYTPSHEWGEATKHIDDLANEYKKNFANKEGNISLGNLERLKKEQYKASKFDMTTTTAKRSASKSLSFAARDTIKANTKSGKLYEIAMKEQQRLINGRKVLERLDGKRPPKVNKFSKKIFEGLAHYASIAIGDKIGGPMGAILGELVGTHLSHAIDKHYGASLMESPAVKKALNRLGDRKPEIAKLLRTEIAKYQGLVTQVKEGKPLPKENPLQEKGTPMDMGTYKLGKNETTGRPELTGQYRKPTEPFYGSIPVKPKEMGTYKLGTKGKYQFRKPGVNFYSKKPTK